MLDLFALIDPDVLPVCIECQEPTANLGGVCTTCLEARDHAEELDREIEQALHDRGKRIPRAVVLGVGIPRGIGEAGR